VICPRCGIRKAKRHCPGIGAAICSVCCANEREETIDCPLACEHLRDAHEHAKPMPLDPAVVPNQDIEIRESFLHQYEWLMVFAGSALTEGALQHPAATDYDAREALEGLVQTYRTRQSGLVYESRLVNPYAAAMRDAVVARLDDLERRAAEAGTNQKLPDQVIVAILAFLQRLEYAHNNGRRRSRAFLDFVRRFHVPLPPPGSEDQTPAEPSEPRVIL
jgi:hypothetical protein